MKKNVKKVENKGIDSTELIMALNELEKEQKNFFIRNTSKKIPTRAIDRIWLICSKKYILVRYT